MGDRHLRLHGRYLILDTLILRSSTRDLSKLTCENCSDYNNDLAGPPLLLARLLA